MIQLMNNNKRANKQYIQENNIQFIEYTIIHSNIIIFLNFFQKFRKFE